MVSITPPKRKDAYNLVIKIIQCRLRDKNPKYLLYPWCKTIILTIQALLFIYLFSSFSWENLIAKVIKLN